MLCNTHDAVSMPSWTQALALPNMTVTGKLHQTSLNNIMMIITPKNTLTWKEGIQKESCSFIQLVLDKSVYNRIHIHV